MGSERRGEGMGDGILVDCGEETHLGRCLNRCRQNPYKLFRHSREEHVDVDGD